MSNITPWARELRGFGKLCCYIKVLEEFFWSGESLLLGQDFNIPTGQPWFCHPIGQ